MKLMSKLIFLPVADQIQSGTYLFMMVPVVPEECLLLLKKHSKKSKEKNKEIATHLYGQEITAETYAICKADLC